MLHSVCQEYGLVFTVYYRLEFIVKSKVEIPKNVYKPVTCNCWAVKWCKELFSLSSIVYQVVSCPTWVILTRKRKVSDMVVSGIGAGPLSSVFQVLVMLVVVVFGLHQKSCYIKHENTVRSYLFMWGALFCLLPDMWQWTGASLTFVAPVSVVPMLKYLQVDVEVESNDCQNLCLCCRYLTLLIDHTCRPTDQGVTVSFYLSSKTWSGSGSHVSSAVLSVILSHGVRSEWTVVTEVTL